MMLVTLVTAAQLQLPPIPMLGGGEVEVSSPAAVASIKWLTHYYGGIPKVDGVNVTFLGPLAGGTEIYADLLDSAGSSVASGSAILTSELPAGIPVTISTSPPANASVVYKLRLTVIAPAPQNANVTFSATGLGADADGIVLTVDGGSYAYSSLPKTFTWAVGSQHTFSWTDPVTAGSAGKRYVWASTSGLSTLKSGTIEVPAGGGAVTANYVTQYRLTISVSPSGAGTTTPAPGNYWHNQSTSVQVSATPNQGYIFSHWLLDGNYAGSSSTITVQMNSAHELVAVFLQVVSQTRYFGYHSHTVNGLNAIRLITTPDVSYLREGDTSIVDQAITISWGIRVWKRSSSGVETEITSGTPVALVSRNSNGQGMQSATWSCPEVDLNPTDSIVVRVYMDFEGWRLLQIFTTEQLNAEQLRPSTWTVYYYTYYNLRLLGGEEGDLYLTVFFYHGNSAYPSRIEGFTWAG